MTLPRRFSAPLIALAAATLSFSSAAQAESATPPAGCTGPASDTWLNLAVEGLRNGNGLLAITLYADNPSKFLVRHGSMYVGRVQASAGTMRACIFLPRTGVYALALYHDENANQVFDRSGLGLPQEGYGFSNNPATIAGLPSFRSVRLNVTRSGLVTRINMKYP